MNDRLLKKMILEAIQDTLDEGDFGRAAPSAGGRSGFGLKANRGKGKPILDQIVDRLDREFGPGKFEIQTQGIAGIFYNGNKHGKSSSDDIFMFLAIDNDDFGVRVKGRFCSTLDEVVETVGKILDNG